MSSRTDRAGSYPETSSSDVDSASQQLLVESQTPRPKLPTFNSSVVRGAHLLNAARVDKRVAISTSAISFSNGPRNTFIQDDGGSNALGNTNRKQTKLKHPTFQAVDLAKQRREASGKRPDVYALPPSPEKNDNEVVLSKAVNRTRLKILKKGKMIKSDARSGHLQLLSELASPTLSSPDLSSLDVASPQLTPDLAPLEAVSDSFVSETHEDQLQTVRKTTLSPPEITSLLPSTELHATVTIEELLPNGQRRCTAIKSSKTSNHKGEQCRRKGTIKIDSEWWCASHAKSHEIVQVDKLSESVAEQQSSPHDPSPDLLLPFSIKLYLRNGDPRCTGTAHQSEQCQRKGSFQTDSGWRCWNHRKSQQEFRLKKPGQRTRKQVIDWDKNPDHQGDSPMHRESPKRKAEVSQVEPDKAPKSPRIQKVKPVILEEGKAIEKKKAIKPQRRRSSPQVLSSARKHSDMVPSVQAELAIEDFVRETDEDIIETDADEESELEKDEQDGSPSEFTKNERDFVSTYLPARTRSAVTSKKAKNINGELDRAFSFLDNDERDGGCQTMEGNKLYDACQETCHLMTKHDLSMGDISGMLNGIRVMLKAIRTNGVEDHRSFKVDAFAYLFRSLVRVLETVHDWLQQHVDTLGRLCVLQILTPLIRDLISFKDTLASWRVEIPQRYQGDSLVKDVLQKVIVPLRNVHEQFRLELDELNHAEENRKTREALQALRQTQKEEELRKTEAYRISKQKLSWRQHLEVVRLQCEPDVHRRRLLAPPKRDLDHAVGERDFNGVVFDRIPMFLPRNTPPPLPPWTDEESTVLALALEEFTDPSAHLVFERIFRTHCRPGGTLRHFTVTDIVTRAARRRAEYIQIFEDHGWAVPNWITQIPVLL